MDINSSRPILSIFEVISRRRHLRLSFCLVLFPVLFSLPGIASAQDCPEFSIDYAIDVQWGVVEFHGWPENISMEENTEIRIIDQEGLDVDSKWYGNNLLQIDWQHRNKVVDLIIAYKNVLNGCMPDTISGLWYPFFDVEIKVGTASGKKGEVVCLPVKAKNFLSINKFEFNFSWTGDLLNFQGIENINPLLAGAFELETIDEEGGIQSLYIKKNSSWSDTLTIDEDDILFEICFTSLVCGPTEILVHSIYNGDNIEFEVAGVPVMGTSNTGKIIVEDENNFSFELIQLCTSQDSNLFDYKLRIIDYSAPISYSFNHPDIPEGNILGIDTNILQIPAGDYQVSVATQCAEKSQPLILADGEGILRGDFIINLDTLQTPDCENKFGGEIIVLVEPAESDYNYLWVEGNVEFDNGILTGLPVGSHTIEVRDSLECSQTKEIIFSQENDLKVSWAEEDTQICPDQKNAKVKLEVSASMFQVSLNGGPAIQNPEIIELPEGNHELLVTTSGGCFKEEALNINMIEPYNPELELGDEIQIFEGDTIAINIPTPPTGSIINWTLGQQTIGNESNLMWLPQRSDTLKLEVIYPPECPYNKEVLVQLLEREPFKYELLPNAFSPNGDMKNDVLKIPISKYGVIKKVLQLDIFDRFGSLIFSKTNNSMVTVEEISWNGMINGQPAESGIYLASAILLLQDGKTQSAEWSIHLVR